MSIDWIDDVWRQTDHRPWPMPDGRWLMTMSWVDLLALHWPVDPQSIEDRIPAGLDLDTFDGDAWLTIIPFVMDDVLPRGMSWWPKPFRFLELNLRTYVTAGGEKPGVWFFSLDAESRLAVEGARRIFSLPYFNADMDRETGGDRTTYRSNRTHRNSASARFVAEYGPAGPVEPSKSGSLDEWLMERYCLYSARGDEVSRCDVHHPPWPLQPATAEIEENTLFEGFDLPVSGPPQKMHYAERIDVLGWGLVPV